jgi:hypothetical protein
MLRDQLKQEIVERIRAEKDLQRELSFKLRVHINTIKRWLEHPQKYPDLTLLSAQKIIREYFKIPETEMIAETIRDEVPTSTIN